VAVKIETVTPWLAIIAPLIGIGTAWLGYKAAVAKANPPADSTRSRAKRLRVLSVTDSTIRSRHWNIRRMKWIMCVFWIVYAAFVALLFGNSRTTYICAGMAVFFTGIFTLFRVQPPSRTLKTASFLIKGDRDEILQNCLSAVTGIGAEVAQFDSAHGIIEAGVRMGAFRTGAIIRIEATKSPPNSVSVRIMSDALSPAALVDFGANARNIRRIKAQLIESGRD
jgi:hypothetical protein